ncbi:MAG: hypothetical protein AB1485_04735 [Candidatus Thermoplasmatota archaeon]
MAQDVPIHRNWIKEWLENLLFELKESRKRRKSFGERKRKGKRGKIKEKGRKTVGLSPFV